MTADGRDLPKYARVALAVRGQIADGTLRPGQSAPSGAALSRVTGYSTLTCRRALRLLIAEGVLAPGPSRNARPRVAGAAQPPGQRDLAAAGQALSAALAARRHERGLTQPELAGRAGVSVTTVGHAETGRLWQSSRFWEQADAALDAGGDLLALHDAYRAAGSAGLPAPGPGTDVPPATGPDVPPATGPDVVPAVPVPPGAAGPPGGRVPGLPGYGLPGYDPPGPVLPGYQAPIQESSGRPGPASVTIVWGNGTITTVKPPDAPRLPAPPPPSLPGSPVTPAPPGP